MDINILVSQIHSCFLSSVFGDGCSSFLAEGIWLLFLTALSVLLAGSDCIAEPGLFKVSASVGFVECSGFGSSGALDVPGSDAAGFDGFGSSTPGLSDPSGLGVSVPGFEELSGF